ncbi:hypothetical protein OIE66_18670 [Nonomuraea sp. NBC_01738]|uniref:aldo/keto reductase n=1 Tax=Nonomuraea sp. NBC_01738 TaxID=2976003 RepID=UPI002E15DCE8|nr:hypothetical protein OIE66_18670 [Nonomuraea sp. NBC_01738]
MRTDRAGADALAERHARLAAARPEELADGAAPMELLLRFILTHPDLHAVIVGSTRPEHVLANVAAAGKGPLPPDVYEAMRKRLTRADALPSPRTERR